MPLRHEGVHEAMVEIAKDAQHMGPSKLTGHDSNNLHGSVVVGQGFYGPRSGDRG